jgi:hypothetical protein
MYTPHVLDSLKDAYRVPEPVPRTEANHELCDYVSDVNCSGLLLGVTLLLGEGGDWLDVA